MPFYEQRFYPKFIPANAKLVAHLFFKKRGDLDTLPLPKGL